MDHKFYECSNCGSKDIVVTTLIKEPWCPWCLERSLVETEPHPVFKDPWLYLSKDYTVKGSTFNSIYLWDGLLVKWPVVINALPWSGNLAGMTMRADGSFGARFKIFSPAKYRDLVSRGWMKSIPAWVR